MRLISHPKVKAKEAAIVSLFRIDDDPCMLTRPGLARLVIPIMIDPVGDITSDVTRPNSARLVIPICMYIG
jgi:hypothetical protein